MEKKLKKFEELINYRFKNPSLLKKALSHTSYVYKPEESNEVFEFLGDSIIGFYLAKELVKLFPNMREGDLSKLKAILSSRKYLFELSKQIKLGDFLYLGKGEKQDRGGEKINITSSAFEALVAAIYFDGGIEEVDKFLNSFFSPIFKTFKGKKIKINDYKSEVQELFQKIWKKAPVYVVEEEMGPEHNKIFRIAMFGVNNELLIKGQGKTKKEAEQAAAKSYLFSLFPEKNIVDFDDFFIEILD